MRATRKRLVLSAAALGGLLLNASSAFAQGCALCYADAAASGPQAQAALRHGILVLMFPPMLIFAAMYFLLYRRTKLQREAHREVPVPSNSSSQNVSEFILDLN
jgi:hypothetical protein